MKQSFPTARILCASIDASPKAQVLDRISKSLDIGKRTLIFTPNTKMLMAAVKNKKLSDILKRSDINLPDGAGLVIASRMLGTPIPERITGIDFAESLLSIAESKRISVYLLGGRPGDAHRAERALYRKFPKLRICGCHNGYFSKIGAENEAIIKQIRASAPSILLVCLGSPAQEEWIIDNIDKLPSVKLAIGLGGSIDVWAGRVKRAPAFFQEVGLEWLWRMALQPRRAGILLDIPLFLLLVKRQVSSASVKN